MEERYSRNIPAITEEDMQKLRNARVAVIGCGGLGGYVLEYLLRIGVGELIAVDGDTFSESNLNRQILCTSENIGTPKVQAAAARAAAVNPEVHVIPVYEFLTADNGDRLIQGADLVIDALDNIESRLQLEDSCGSAGIPLVHGAIGGWNVQVMVVRPGSRILHALYGNGSGHYDKSVLPMTPAFCAALQVSAAVELLCGREPEMSGSLVVGSLKSPSLDPILLQ